MDYAQLRNVNCQGSVKITDVESFVSTALKLTRKKNRQQGEFLFAGGYQLLILASFPL